MTPQVAEREGLLLEAPDHTDSWQQDLLQAGEEALGNDAGAVVIRLARREPQIVSRVYRAENYEDTTELRRVAVRRSTQLLNGDQSGWAYYVAIRYATGRVVIWTDMHSILIEEGTDHDH